MGNKSDRREQKPKDKNKKYKYVTTTECKHCKDNKRCKEYKTYIQLPEEKRDSEVLCKNQNRS